MRLVPEVGETWRSQTCDIVVLEVGQKLGRVKILAERVNEILYPFVTWLWDTNTGTPYSGNYFNDLNEARLDYEMR